MHSRSLIFILSGLAAAQAMAGAITGAVPTPVREMPPPAPLFDVRDFGAKGDGVTYDTAALTRAIDACAGTGGSVVLRGGTFLTAQLRLKGGMTFYVAKDAVVSGGLSPADYPVLLPKEIAACDDCGLELKKLRRSLLYADKADGLRIDGGGVIDGRGASIPMTGDESTRPSVLRVFQSRDVVVRDVTLKNSRMWTQVYSWCDNLLLDHVTVDSPPTYKNQDGLDLNDCHGVVVRDCDLDSEDDTICLKSQSPRGLRDVLVQNNRIRNHRANAIKIGTATFGPISDIRILDNTVTHAKFGGVCIESVDGSVVKDVTVRNLVMQGVAQPFFIRLGDRADRRKEARVHTSGPGSITGVTIEDVSVTGVHAETAPSNTVTGLAGAKLGAITFRNIRIAMPGGVTKSPAAPADQAGAYPQSNMSGMTPASVFYIRHAENVVLENVTFTFLKPDVRPWLASDDASVRTEGCGPAETGK